MTAIFFFYHSFLSQTPTIHRTACRGMEGTIFYSTLPLPPAHEHSGIYLQLCMRDDYHIFLIAPRDLPPYRITIWLIDVTLSFFVCLRDDLILAFLLQQFEAGNRWIRTRINYYPSCITSEPTNRVIQLKYLSEYCFRSSSLSHYTFLISKQFTTNYLAS